MAEIQASARTGTGPTGTAPDVTIVLETENVQRTSVDELSIVLRRLEEQLGELARPAELLVFLDDASDPATVGAAVRAAGIEQLPDTDVVLVEDGPSNYYEMKNEGARRARAPYVLYIDSDTPPDPGWLGTLLGALEEGRDVVAGQTYLDLRPSLYDRAVAAWWNFPLRPDGAPTVEPGQRFYANNFGVRRELFVEKPFVVDRRLRGACATWRDARIAEGTSVWLATGATVAHEPYPRERMAARALWKGRDRALAADRTWRLRSGFTGSLRMLVYELRRVVRRIDDTADRLELHGPDRVGATALGFAHALVTWAGFVVTLVDDDWVERHVEL